MKKILLLILFCFTYATSFAEDIIEFGEFLKYNIESYEKKALTSECGKKISLVGLSSTLLSEEFELNLLNTYEVDKKKLSIFSSQKTSEHLVLFDGVATVIISSDDDNTIMRVALTKINRFLSEMKFGKNPMCLSRKHLFDGIDDQKFSNIFVSDHGKRLYGLLCDADTPKLQHRAVEDYLESISHENELYLSELIVCSTLIRNKHHVSTIMLDTQSLDNNLSYLWPITLSVQFLCEDLISKHQQTNPFLTDYEKIKVLLIYVSQYKLAFSRMVDPIWTIFNQCGSCANSAYLFAALTSCVRIKTRIISICDYRDDGHAVCECKIGEKWCFFDPSYASYYMNNGAVLSLSEIRKGHTRTSKVLHVTLNPEKISNTLSNNSGFYYYPDIIEEARTILYQNTLEYSSFYIDMDPDAKNEVSYSPQNQGAYGLGNEVLGNRRQIIKISNCVPNKKYKLEVKFKSSSFTSPNDMFEGKVHADGAVIEEGDTYKFFPRDNNLEIPWEILFATENDNEVTLNLEPTISPSVNKSAFLYAEYYRLTPYDN